MFMEENLSAPRAAGAGRQGQPNAPPQERAVQII
jgi:hypothetical protein